MSASVWLRIAAVLALLYAVGHTAGMPWTPAHGAAEQPVLDAMRGIRFIAVGNSRTYWDFYQGFGVAISVLLLTQAVLLWQQADLAARGADRLRPMLIMQIVGFAGNGIVAFKYIFSPPLVLSAAIIVCLVGAVVRLSAGRER